MSARLLLAVHDVLTDVDGSPLTPEAAVTAPCGLAGLRGAFALAWRDDDGHLHLARDALGHRSLYWGFDASGYPVFGPRLHDVLAQGASRALNPVALATYLATAYVPGTATLAAGVEAVPAGAELVFGHAPRSSPEVRPFWRLPPSTPASQSDDALRDRLRSALEATVTRLLPDDPTLGCSLSGGVDSSLVAALLRRLGDRPLRAFSITFGPPHRDELAFSGLVARNLRAEHVPLTVTEADVRARFDATVAALSEPNGDPLTVPNAMIFKAAREAGHTALFNGEGGDPTFGGPKNAPLLLSELYGDEADGPLARERAYLMAHQRLWGDLDQALAPEVRAAITDGAVEGLVTPWLDDARWPSFLDRLMAMNIDWKGPQHILPKVEHLGLAAGVRPRSPLFDRDLVAHSFRIPARLKRAGATEKFLLKESVRDLLPEAIIERPKSGMLVPVEAWFSGPLQGWARERLLDGLAPRGLFRRDFLERLASGEVRGLRPRRGIRIWLLLTLESWLRQVLDGGRS